MRDEFLWVEKYRPRTVDETILPDNIKAVFKQFVEQKNIPNLILSGTAGTGKTTIARAMLEELQCDYIVINGSLDNGIDVLRTRIMDFASSVSFMGGRKYVILDEADYLTTATQSALRNFMEEYSSNCGFILTCNFKHKIIEPLHSRCSTVEFKLNKADKPKIAAQFMKRICDILKTENIEFEKEVIVEIIKKYIPDWRKVLNELQKYSAVGKIDSGILISISDTTINQLIDYMKQRNFTNVRKWVAENSDLDQAEFFRLLYTVLVQKLDNISIPAMILHLAKYQYQAAFCVNHEINMSACLLEIMADCNFGE